MDRQVAKNLDEFLEIVRENIVEFRIRHPEFDKLPIIVETETNSRFDGDVVEKHLTFERVFDFTRKNVGIVEFARESTISRTGIIKTYPRTISYVWYLNETLALGQLKILSNCTTLNTLGIDRILKEAQDEFIRFSWPDVDYDNTRYTRRRGPSGKIGGKNDDMCIAIQMLVYTARTRVFEKNMIKSYISRNGWSNTGKSRYLENHAFRKWAHLSL